jgi:hypothetical protein
VPAERRTAIAIASGALALGAGFGVAGRKRHIDPGRGRCGAEGVRQARDQLRSSLSEQVFVGCRS